MTSMKDFLQAEVTDDDDDDADAVTSELYVENTIGSPVWYTNGDNHVSLVSENIEKVIKVQTDVLDDCMWENRIKITKDVANQSNMELPFEYQDFTDNTYLNPRNTNDEIFCCYICGKSFIYNYFLKVHLAKHKKRNYKANKCKFCGKLFKLKFGLDRHIQKHHNSKCATIVSTAPHINISNNYIISYPEQTKIISNHTLERNSSDQIEQKLVRSDLFPEPVPLDLAKREQLFQKIVRNYFQQTINMQKLNELRHNAISNNNSPALNSKQKINFSRETLRETNSSYQMNLANSNESIVSTASQNSMANILNTKQVKDLFTNVRERNSSDQEDSVNGNESTLAKEPHDLMVEQFPINTANNNNIVSIVRDTPYFCIRKLPNIKNEFLNDDYGQTSLNNLIFTCRICKNSPSTDIHSFALHMRDHKKCNMHECIVCDKTFKSVVLWTAHMTYHQQQIDLNVSTVQFNFLESESNTFNTNNENIKLESNVIQNSISIEDNKTDSAKMSRNQKKTPKQLTSIDCNKSIILSDNIESTNEYENKLSVLVNTKNNNQNNRINKRNKKKSTFCIICNKHFAYIGALTNHMLTHEQWVPCDVCEKKFSTPLQLNAHRNKSFSEVVPYVCKICNKSYRLKNRWNCHLRSHYKKDDSNLKIKQHTNFILKSNISKLKIESICQDNIKCRYCKKECDSISQWKNHMSMSKECRRHCKSYLPEFSSNKTVLDKTYLNTYDNTGSQKDKLMDIIQQKPVIKKHISMIHKQTYEPVICVCGITLKNKFSYEAHLRNTHNRLINYYEGSNSTYYERTSGQVISVNKKNTMKYICEICKMKFADNITLQKHTEIHTLNMYKCNACGQQFETNLALSNHIWENHSDI